MPSLSKRSSDKLIGVDPDLVKVILVAIQDTEQDFAVVQGVRTRQEQAELFAQGRTTAELIKHGVVGVEGKPHMKVVTKTMESNHIPDKDGYGKAVDLCPYPIDWNDISKFHKIAKAMKAASVKLGVPIVWGGDWTSFRDYPHFEKKK